MPLSAGAAFGPYTIVGLVGAGGMGEVYKARDTRLDRTVALKILPQTTDNDRRQRFEREARAISRLQHPHICALYDVGSQDGVEYLVMEFLEGPTLAQRIEKGPIPLPELLRHAAEIVDALDHAHRASICHRDLKPANIILTKTGVKLLDFGLARALEAEAVPVRGETTTMALTREGVILGTLSYMSPEQLEGKPGDTRSDIFACGAVLYEMATGRRAFDGKSGASLIAQIMSADPPRIRVVQPVAPSALERIVGRCLAKDPEDRWQSARDIGAALEFVREEPAATAPEPRSRATRGWIPWALFSLAVITMAVIGAAVAYFWRPAAETTALSFTISPPPDATFSGPGVPTISPDGSRVGFIASAAGGVHVWIRSLDNMQARPLVGTEGARSLFWSPDGKNIAFDANGKLKRIPAEGGAVQTICDSSSSMRGGTWNQDGIIVFAPNVQTTLFRVLASGGDPVPLGALDVSRNENSHRWPQFLPDGKHYLYFGRTVNAGGSAVYVASLDSANRSERQLILKTESNAIYVPPPDGGRRPGYLLHVRDRTLLAQPFDAGRLQLTGDPTVIGEQVAESTPQAPAHFSATPRLLTYGGQGGGSFQLVWMDRAGKRLSELKTGDGSYARPTLSPDAKRIAASVVGVGTSAPDVFLVDISRNISTRFTFSGIFGREVVWSPDGKYVAYTLFRNGNPALARKLSDGSGPEEIIAKTPLSGVCDWSRDGKWILYRMPGETTQTDLWFLPAAGGGPPRPFLQTKALENCGQFSPDGKWIAYSSDESGTFQVYVQGFPSGGKWQISKEPALQPRWRRDGKELFFYSPDGSMMAADIQAGTAIESGIPKKLFPVTFGTGLGGIDFDVTPDGQRFVIPIEVRNNVAEPITAIWNWTSLLKR